MQKKMSTGQKVTIVTVVTILFVSLSIPVLEFSSRVFSIASTLKDISSEISRLEYQATWNSGYDYAPRIRELYEKRDLIAARDSIAQFLVTSTGTDGSQRTHSNRYNRGMLITTSIVSFLLIVCIDILLLVNASRKIAGHIKRSKAKLRSRRV